MDPRRHPLRLGRDDTAPRSLDFPRRKLPLPHRARYTPGDMKPPEKLPRTPANVPKLSQSLVDFAGPLLANVQTTAAFETAIALAVQLWNIGALPEAKQPEALWKLSETLRNHPALNLPGWAAADLSEYIERRKTVYAEDRRIVTEHRVAWHKGQPRLEVVSYDLRVAEAHTQPQSPPTAA